MLGRIGKTPLKIAKLGYSCLKADSTNNVAICARFVSEPSNVNAHRMVVIEQNYIDFEEWGTISLDLKGLPTANPLAI
jgi:hypothetical protein